MHHDAEVVPSTEGETVAPLVKRISCTVITDEMLPETMQGDNPENLTELEIEHSRITPNLLNNLLRVFKPCHYTPLETLGEVFFKSVIFYRILHFFKA